MKIDRGLRLDKAGGRMTLKRIFPDVPLCFFSVPCGFYCFAIVYARL